MVLVATKSFHQIVEFALVLHVEWVLEDIFEDVNCAIYDLLRGTYATFHPNDRSVSIRYLSPNILQLGWLAYYRESDVLGKRDRFLHPVCLKERVNEVDPILDQKLKVFFLATSSHCKHCCC
jgi:hypothetical protein